MLVKDVKTKQPKVYRQWQEQPETICPPQGETLGEAQERLHSAIAKLTKKHRSEGLVAVVLPEPLASILCHLLRHDDLADLWKRPDGAAPWEVIDVAPAEIGTK
jgi:probable phosphoglycerate mutase